VQAMGKQKVERKGPGRAVRLGCNCSWKKTLRAVSGEGRLEIKRGACGRARGNKIAVEQGGGRKGVAGKFLGKGMISLVEKQTGHYSAENKVVVNWHLPKG